MPPPPPPLSDAPAAPSCASEGSAARGAQRGERTSPPPPTPTLPLTARRSLEPDINLVPLAQIFLNHLGNRSFSKGQKADFSKILTAFKYLRRLFHLYLSILQKEGKATGVTASQWLAVRTQAEGLALMWFTHSDFEVRQMALSLLATFSEPVFDDLENAKGRAPKESRLIYILQVTPRHGPPRPVTARNARGGAPPLRPARSGP